MIIKSLKIQNFRKFTELDLSFPIGLIGVVGRNGTGKSTLLEIFAWLLYGSSALKTKNEEIYPDFLDIPGQSSGQMEFSLNSGDFRVWRSYKPPSKSEAMLYMGDKILAEGPREVTEIIQQMTGLDYKAFQTSFYTRQSELNLLTELQPAERGKRLEEMLRLNKINDIINNNIKGDLRQLLGEEEALQRILEDMPDIEEKVTQSRQECEQKSIHIKELDGNRNRRRAEIARLREDFSRLEAKREKYRKTGTELEIRQQRLHDLEKRKSELKQDIGKVENNHNRYNELRHEIEPLKQLSEKLEENEEQRVMHENLKSRKEQAAQIDNRLTGIEADGKQLNLEIRKLNEDTGDYNIINNNIKSQSKKKEQLSSEVSNLRVTHNRVENELTRLRQQLEEIENLGPDAVCSFCLRPFDGDRGEIKAHFEREMYALTKREEESREKLEKNHAILKETAENLSSLESRRDQLDPLRGQISTKQGKIEQLRQEFKRLRKQREDLSKLLSESTAIAFDYNKYLKLKQTVRELNRKKQECDRLVGRVDKLESMKANYEKLCKEINIIINNISSCKKEIEEIGFSEEEYLKRKQALETDTEDLRILDITYADTRGDLKSLQLRTEQLLKRKKEIDEASRRVNELTQDKIYLHTLKELLGELKVELAKRIRPKLRKIASELLEMMTEGKFSDMELDENYDIHIRDFGELHDLKRFSGGEQDLGNLCLRMAISRMLAESSRLESGFLILDEVFGSQDIYRQENILNAIAGLQDFFHQIFVVTHVEDIKQAVSNLITIEENPDGSSIARME